MDAGAIKFKILFSSFLIEGPVDLNLNKPILWISQNWIANCIKVPVKVAVASNPV